MPMFFLGAFVATFVLSRWALWVLGKWDGGWARLLAAHAVSVVICWAVFAFGAFDGKIYWEGGTLFLLPQGVWLLVDYFRGKSAREG